MTIFKTFPDALSLARRLLMMGLVMLGVLVFAAPSAGAKLVEHKLPFTLDPVEIPHAVAISQVTENVYVAANGTNTVKVFGKEGGVPAGGVPSEVTGVETPEGGFNFGGGEEPSGVAVDNSGGVSTGDVYVADTEHGALDKFRLNGGKYEYVCQFRGYGNIGDGCMSNEPVETTSPTERFVGVGGVAVDTHGNVYVTTFSPGVVYEFSDKGEDVSETPIPTGEPAGLAVDSNGVVYVQDYQGAVYKLSPEWPTKFAVELLDSGASFAVAVDPSTNDVYVDHKTHIVEREAADGNAPGAVIGELKPENLASEGIAVSGTSHNVYVSNNVTNKVEAYDLAEVPNVTKCVPGETHAHQATLTGEVEPGMVTGADWLFEYGPYASGGFSGPGFERFSTSLEPIGGNETVDAAVTGLVPNTTYDCRLVSTIGEGIANNGEEGIFTTLGAEPEVSGVEAIDITTNSVTFRGLVNPQNTPPTTYHFEYGETTSSEQRLPQIAIGASDNPVPVEQAVSGLKPDTTYHYTLWAENEAGKALLVDHTFTTSSEGVVPSELPVVQTMPASGVSQTAVTISGAVNPEGSPTTYEFEVGTSASYGTQVFGEAAASGSTQTFERTLTGLAPGTTYHYRVCASNQNGTRCGTDESFTTTGIPGSVLTAPPATPLIATTPIAFPTEAGTTTITTTTKALTNAQKLAKALKACRKERRKKQATCEKQARSKYGAARQKKRK